MRSLSRASHQTSCYVIAYDIPDNKRCTKVHKILLGYGKWTQYSLFECFLSRKQLLLLQARLVPTGHRIKALLDYSRGPEKTWVYGALRVRDGKELTRCAASRNSTNSIPLLEDIEADNPSGDIYIITDNLSSHNSAQTRAWMAEHPRLHHVFIPKGACWLNLQEGWWRLFRRDALAGQRFANPKEIEQATRIATAQLNHRANPCIWGRPPKDHRHYRRLFCYRI